jgi:hypothetical protein
LKNMKKNMKKLSYSHCDYRNVSKVFDSDVKSTPNFKNHAAFFRGRSSPEAPKNKPNKASINSSIDLIEGKIMNVGNFELFLASKEIGFNVW